MNALELCGLRKSFGLTEVIRGTDLEVREGERLALIGPNGAGKSTLFSLISGQLVPDAGSIRLHGAEVAGQPPYRLARAGLGRSFQVSNFFASLSVRDNLCIGAMWTHEQRLGLCSQLAGHQALARQVDALLDQLELNDRAHTPARDLSYSEQRLLEIGMTVAGDPRCVLLDEPTAGMSRDETQRVVSLVRRISEGRTLLIIEHDMNVVFDLADRIAVLVYGRVIAVDTPEAVRCHPEVRAAYLGQHPTPEAQSHA
jgi:branched-chain amino acid transport system ATP-binding protein